VPRDLRTTIGCFLGLTCLLLLATGCGRLFEAEGQLAGSIDDVAKCASSLDAPSSKPLPNGLPVPVRTHAYQYIVDGPTEFWFTTVPGSSNTIVDLRNEIKGELVKAGYVQIAQDQELGAEADFYFAGQYVGSVQVRPLCEGRIRVRYGFGAGSLGAPNLRHKGPPIQPPNRGSAAPTTTTVPSAPSNCLAPSPMLGHALSWMPAGLPLPPGSYPSEDLTPSSGSPHVASFVVPGSVADFFDFVSNNWPGSGATITFGEQDPNDSEFVFQYGGQQGSMVLTRPFCDPGYSSLDLAYGGP
jgi:hypothetical protein